jgi:hypothetical protein
MTEKNPTPTKKTTRVELVVPTSLRDDIYQAASARGMSVNAAAKDALRQWLGLEDNAQAPGKDTAPAKAPTSKLGMPRAGENSKAMAMLGMDTK